MNASGAKKIIREALASVGRDNHLTARTVGFQDLARTSCVFVRVHGWRPNPYADILEGIARSHGFRVEYDS